MSTDRIEKRIVLHAPIARVWNAISDSTRFGTWFGMKLDGPFIEGQAVSGCITETQIDDDIAEKQRPYVGEPVTLWIVALESLRRFAFRWNPLAECELTTLVEFTLTEQADGTLLEIVESGFDALPQEHRDNAFRGNSEGWALQGQLIAKYLAVDAPR
jgi:uncharacterized protein YndB with AHSA1/START domain